MSKYIDLIGQITERLDVPCGNIRLGIHEALAYLDDHPELTGRTITASEFDEAVESCITEDATVPPHKFAERLGVVCVPDPEPTESVPGRTITEGDLIAAVDETNHEDMNEYQKARALLVHLGHTIPEPGLTNFERLEALLEGGDINAQWGLRGGGVMFATELAHALDKAGVRVVTESE